MRRRDGDGDEVGIRNFEEDTVEFVGASNGFLGLRIKNHLFNQKALVERETILLA